RVFCTQVIAVLEKKTLGSTDGRSRPNFSYLGLVPNPLRNLALLLKPLSDSAPARATNPPTLIPERSFLGQEIGALAPRLGPEKAAAVCTRVATRLAPLAASATPPGELDAVVRGVAALARSMPPREARSVCAPVIAVLLRHFAADPDEAGLPYLAI